MVCVCVCTHACVHMLQNMGGVYNSFCTCVKQTVCVCLVWCKWASSWRAENAGMNVCPGKYLSCVCVCNSVSPGQPELDLMYVCRYLCMCVCVCMHICMYWILTQKAHKHVHAQTCRYTHTHTHENTHTNTHTLKQRERKSVHKFTCTHCACTVHTTRRTCIVKKRTSICILCIFICIQHMCRGRSTGGRRRGQEHPSTNFKQIRKSWRNKPRSTADWSWSKDKGFPEWSWTWKTHTG